MPNHVRHVFAAITLTLFAALGSSSVAAQSNATISGTVAEWQDWTEMEYPESGDYWFPRGLATLAVDRDRDVGLYHEPNRYDLYCEPFAERIELARGARDAGAREWAQRYAQRLEHYCRLAPDNWFNLYPVWKVPA